MPNNFPLFLILLFSFCQVGLSTDDPAREKAKRELDSLIQQAQVSCQGDREKRLEYVQRAIRLSEELGDPNLAFRAMAEKVALLATSFKFEEAIELAQVARGLENVNSSNEDSAKLYLYQGLAYMNPGTSDLVAAIECLRYAEALVEDNPKQLALVNNYLGICLRRIGCKGEALHAMRQALKYSTDANYHTFDFQILTELSTLLISHGKLDEAEVFMQQLLTQSNGKSVIWMLQANLSLAEIALLREDYDLARELSEKVVDSGSVNHDFYVRWISKAYLLIGKSYFAQEEYAKAETNFQRSLDAGPDDLSFRDLSRNHVGIALIRQGQVAQGLELLTAVAESSETEHFRVDACKKLAEHFIAEDDYESALKYERQLREIEENKVSQRLRLVESRFRPMLMVNRLQLIANEEKTKALAEKINSEKARLVANASLKEASFNRRIRNIVIVGSLILVLGSLFYFQSLFRIRQAKLQLAESQKLGKLERQLAQTRRIESIGQLTSNLAHDFNNILQVVCHSNEMLKDSLREQLDETHIELLSSSTNAVELGARITSQLLSFSGKHPVTPEPTSVRKIIENNSLLFSSACGDEISIEQQCLASDHLVVNVDRGRLSNAILNLLLNAQRAMGGRGQIELRMSDHVGLEAGEDSDLYLRIDVIDTGCGMSTHEVERACEPYFTSKSEGTGSGLGLSSVKGFSDQVGGVMKIDSEPGKGTTVSIFIPATYGEVSGNVACECEGSRVSLDMASEVRCLVVEDNDAVQASIVSLLNLIDVECLECKNADQAIEILKCDQNFQLIISDIRMPGEQNGMDLARWLANNLRHATTILISGNEAPPYAENCIFLRKPFQLSELREAIATGLENQAREVSFSDSV